MKIDPRTQPGDLSQEQVKGASTSRVQTGGPANTSGGSSTPGEDTVTLSGAHGQVQTLASSLAAVPEVRSDRVNALQEQVRNGTYSPDSQKVADAMIKDHSKVDVKG